MGPVGLSPGPHTCCPPAALGLGTEAWGPLRANLAWASAPSHSPGWNQTNYSESLSPKVGFHRESLQPWGLSQC